MIFRSPLIFKDEDGLPYTLVVDLVYESDILNRRVTVPTGFKTDLASIPRGLWNVLPKSGRYDRAAVVHDFLYATNGVTRKQADDVLNEAMTYLKVPTWQRRMIYLGVRVGGWKPWNAYRRQQTANHT
jgi:hypothetical protein